MSETAKWVREYTRARNYCRGIKRPEKPRYTRADAERRRAEVETDAAVMWGSLSRPQKIDAIFAALSEIYQPGEVVSPAVLAKRLGAKYTQTVCNCLDVVESDPRWKWRRVRDSS